MASPATTSRTPAQETWSGLASNLLGATSAPPSAAWARGARSNPSATPRGARSPTRTAKAPLLNWAKTEDQGLSGRGKGRTICRRICPAHSPARAGRRPGGVQDHSRIPARRARYRQGAGRNVEGRCGRSHARRHENRGRSRRRHGGRDRSVHGAAMVAQKRPHDGSRSRRPRGRRALTGWIVASGPPAGALGGGGDGQIPRHERGAGRKGIRRR